jgi:hypothetical protein
MSYATLTPTADGSLAFRSSYDPGLVAALKARIPYQERRWDAGNKCWLIAPGNERALADICDQHLGVTLTVPANAVAQSRSETRLLRVEYIGAPKERDDGTFSAFGYCNGDWSVIFPQDVLKSWFELGVGGERPTTPRRYHPLRHSRRQAQRRRTRAEEGVSGHGPALAPRHQ